MKLQHNHFKLNRYILSAMVLIVILAASSAVVYMNHGRTKAAPTVKVAVGSAVPSQFTFTGAKNWWQGATRMTDMALFYKPNDCFTSIQHNTGTIAADEAEHKKTQAKLVSNGYTITSGPTVPLTLQTNTGPMSYTLQQSSMTAPANGEKVLGGVEHGYIQLPGSYIYIEGNCETFDELAATIPALQAIKFDAAK